MDRYEKHVRSAVMSKILGRNTAPELLLRRRLWAYGLRGFRLHCALPGKPDIAYANRKLAVFVDGCFWHCCPECKIAKPKSRKAYWTPKLRGNRLAGCPGLKGTAWFGMAGRSIVGAPD